MFSFSTKVDVSQYRRESQSGTLLQNVCLAVYKLFILDVVQTLAALHFAFSQLLTNFSFILL